MGLPVWRVSITARSGMRSSRIRASFERTLERAMDGNLDHTPDLNAVSASAMAKLTSSVEADFTLLLKVFQVHFSRCKV